jgi:hypothetical protein
MVANNPIVRDRSQWFEDCARAWVPATRLRTEGMRTEAKIGLIYRFPNDLHFAMFDLLIGRSAFETLSGIAAWFSQLAAVTAAVPNICIVTH